MSPILDQLLSHFYTDQPILRRVRSFGAGAWQDYMRATSAEIERNLTLWRTVARRARAVAIHEAAHYVIAKTLNQPILSASIMPTETSAGRVILPAPPRASLTAQDYEDIAADILNPDRDDEITNRIRQRIRDKICVLLAGGCTSWLFLSEKTGDAGDILKAEYCAKRLHSDGLDQQFELIAMRRRTLHLLREHASEILGFAERLLAEKEITL